MPKYDYRILAQNSLAELEALARRRESEGFELQESEADLTIFQALQAIKQGRMVTVNARKEKPEDEPVMDTGDA